MDVEVRHFLSAAPADVGKQAIALLDRAGVASDLADGADEAGDLLRRSLFREIVPRHVGALRNDQDVQRRQRVDVVERQAVLCFQHGSVGNVTPKDLREDIVAVVGLLGVDGHGLGLTPLDRLASLATTKSDE